MAQDLHANAEGIRLLLLDDHALLRESLARLLASEPGFEMTGQCGTVEEALDLLQRSPVDVVLLGFHPGGALGNQFIRSARAAGFKGMILLMTAGIDVSELVGAMHLGASGVFLKHNSTDALTRAIRRVATGEIWMDREVIEVMAGEVKQIGDLNVRKPLTQRERQVLHGIFEGLTNKKIASQIGVSEGTVKATLQQLFRKAHVRTRAQLVRAALEGSL